ncbi:ABC transporter ATP-binding protein [Pseudomonadota bacterium]
MTEKIELPKKLFPFFWYFLRNYKKQFIARLAIEPTWAIYNVMSAFMTKIIIDRITNYSGELSMVYQVVMWPAIFYVLSFVIMKAGNLITNFIEMRFIPQVQKDIYDEMFTYLEGHSHNYFQNNFAGSVANKIGDMARGFSGLMMIFLEFLGIGLAFIAIYISMYFINGIFANIMLIWAVLFFSIYAYFSTKVGIYSKDLSESKSELTGKVVDSVSNVLNVRLFSRNKFERSYLGKQLEKVVVKDLLARSYQIKLSSFTAVSSIIFNGSMLYALIHLRSKGLVTIGDFAFIMTSSIGMMWQIQWLAKRYSELIGIKGECDQALSIITAAHNVVDAPRAKKLKVTRGEIEFKKVGFCYNKTCQIFNNKNIKIEGGEKVGLVGFSGSGKSTFVNLILRYFDINTGKILIDGQNVAKVTQDSLREGISMIPQDTSLFHRTLIENIRYGRLDATNKEVEKAAKKANCDEFISKLEEGYDSMVGERGIKLSGGQRQRIAIARAILKDAPILILDEATSSLDSVTERYIQESLDTLMKGRTAIVVAHRLSTLVQMDRILVFENGVIIEEGSHKQLLQKKDGHYKMLWDMQSDGFLPDDDDR